MFYALVATQHFDQSSFVQYDGYVPPVDDAPLYFKELSNAKNWPKEFFDLDVEWKSEHHDTEFSSEIYHLEDINIRVSFQIERMFFEDL